MEGRGDNKRKNIAKTSLTYQSVHEACHVLQDSLEVVPLLDSTYIMDIRILIVIQGSSRNSMKQGKASFY